MAVTVVVLSGGEPGAPALSLTLDAPRLVIGRGEGCDVRLPDASVSHRHATIRQRGGEHVLLDEGSTNGTFMDRVRLPPQTPRALRSGERVRVGRVWLELRFEPAMVKGSTAVLAKELALALVARGLRAQREEPGPRIIVIEGSGTGATLILEEPHRTYTLGRAETCDLLLDETAARRHACVSRKGDALFVEDTGSAGGTRLDGAPIHSAAWKPGQVLEIGESRLAFEYPAAAALAEIEQSPDERMPDGEGPEAPAVIPTASGDPALEAPPPLPPAGALDEAPRPRLPAEPGGWSMVDSAVALLALGVLVISVVGAFLMLGR
jgi:pSer/pThr/pTyr-binding forkhead associated (FHA) protein